MYIKTEIKKFERTNTILAVLHDAENKLHTLKNTWPSGISSIDNEIKEKITWYENYLLDIKSKLSDC